MKSMDNAKVIETIEKQTLHKYLEKLADAEMHQVTLFKIFPYTGAPDLSQAVHYVLVDDINKMAGLNSGSFLN
jgi:hypothetical protein